MSAQRRREIRPEGLEKLEESAQSSKTTRYRPGFIFNKWPWVFTKQWGSPELLIFYEEGPRFNANMPQALNNMGGDPSHLGSWLRTGDTDESGHAASSRAAELSGARRSGWLRSNSSEAQNWLKTSGRGSVDVYF